MKKLTMRSQLVTTALIGSLAIAMAGCATKPAYQPTSQSGPKVMTNAQGVPNYHLVKRGDTVSDIAARYRLNYRQVGAMNGLDSKYTIYSGQWLKLWEGTPAATSRPTQQPTYRPPINNAPVTQSPVIQSPVIQSPVNNPTANSASNYGYPSPNQVIRNFDAQAGNMGMWFAGQEGDPVIASQAGTVLYSGNGLPEYGNLIMIRHSDNYITAYAHNSQLLVKEGDQVQRAQRIANMGRSGQTDQVALEFQVRLNGNPIDPRAVLAR